MSDKGKQTPQITLPIEFVAPFSLHDCEDRLRGISGTYPTMKVEVTVLPSAEKEHSLRLYGYTPGSSRSWGEDVEITGYLEQQPNSMTRVVLTRSRMGRVSRSGLIFYALIFPCLAGIIFMPGMPLDKAVGTGLVAIFLLVCWLGLWFVSAHPDLERYVTLIHQALTYVPPEPEPPGKSRSVRALRALDSALRFLERFSR